MVDLSIVMLRYQRVVIQVEISTIYTDYFPIKTRFIEDVSRTFMNHFISTHSLWELLGGSQKLPAKSSLWCHQPHGWLENPRAEWRFLAGKITDMDYWLKLIKKSQQIGLIPSYCGSSHLLFHYIWTIFRSELWFTRWQYSGFSTHMAASWE